MASRSTIANCALALLLAAGAGSTMRAQTFSVFHNFQGADDGGNPLNGLVADSSGNLYGTGNAGGRTSNGVVYEITPAGVISVLHNFAGGNDGANPEGVLIRDGKGNLYGTTTAGGATGAGTVFKVTAAGTETVLHHFTGGADGWVPEAGLARDSAGNLYGTTTSGGASGNGVVFRLTPPAEKGAGWQEQVLYSFSGGADGATPVGGVAFDSAGNLYGTTSAGAAGYGTVFQLAAGTWTETTLHTFANGDDGAVPYAGLIYRQGKFYGAATEGGVNGGGTIFELSPSGGGWTFTAIYSNPGWGISGAFRNLTMDANGVLYGTTHCDGDYSAGTVYKLTPGAGSWTYTQLYEFTGGADGLYSFSNLVLLHGALYGTTNEGGANGMGVIFKVGL